MCGRRGTAMEEQVGAATGRASVTGPGVGVSPQTDFRKGMLFQNDGKGGSVGKRLERGNARGLRPHRQGPELKQGWGPEHSRQHGFQRHFRRWTLWGFVAEQCGERMRGMT